MTPLEASLKIKIENLRKLAREDHEAAHVLQDEIYRQVINGIAYSPTRYSKADLKNLAARAAIVENIDFERYFA